MKIMLLKEKTNRTFLNISIMIFKKKVFSVIIFENVKIITVSNISVLINGSKFQRGNNSRVDCVVPRVSLVS